MIINMFGGYLYLAKRGFTDSMVVLLGGCLSCASFVFLPHSSQVWHIVAIMGVGGAGQGLFMGAMVTMPNEYLTKVFPKKMSMGRAVYNQLAAIGNIVAPVPITAVYLGYGIQWAYTFVAGAFVLSTCFTMVSISMKNAKIRALEGKKDEEMSLTAEQHREMVATGAMPETEFFEHFKARIAGKLKEAHYSDHIGWNGYVQALVIELVESALPTLRPWNDATHGQEQLEDIAMIYMRMGNVEKVREIEEKHQLDFHLLMGGDESSHHHSAGGTTGVGLSVAALQQRVKSVRDLRARSVTSSSGNMPTANTEVGAADQQQEVTLNIGNSSAQI